MIPSVDIVIPSHNGRELLAKNLSALQDALRAWTRAGDRSATVFVSDDGSTDGTAELLQSRFPEVVRVHEPERRGFAIAMNRGAAAGQGAIILALNNDVRVEPDFLAPLLELFREPDVFAVTARVLRHDPGAAAINQSGQSLFHRSGRIRTRLVPSEIMESVRTPAELSVACGACSAFRRDLFESLGGFDPLFSPFYWEDADLSYRALKRQYRILYQPASTVHHEHGATVRGIHSPHEVERIFWRNFILFNLKNLADRSARAAFTAYCCVLFGCCLVMGKGSRLRALIDAFTLLPTVSDRRRSIPSQTIARDRDLWRRFDAWEERLRSSSPEKKA